MSYAGRHDENGGFIPLYRITLASQVDSDTCRRVNLDYLDFQTFNIADYQNDPDTLIVERAGRDLYLVAPTED